MKRILLLAVTLTVAAGLARDLKYWQVSAVWDTNTSRVNWKDESGTQTYFADGDNVTIGLGFGMIAVSGNVNPANIEFKTPVSPDFVIEFAPNCYIGSQVLSMVKTGPGLLKFSATDNVTSAYGFQTGCPFEIQEGTLEIGGANNPGPFSGGPDGMEYQVRNGATFRVIRRNTLGSNAAGSEGSRVSVRVDNGGTFQLGPHENYNIGNTIKDLTLEGGANVKFAGLGDNTDVGTLRVLGTVKVANQAGNVQPVTIANPDNWRNIFFGINWNTATPTCFDVADVTGDDGADLIMNIPIARRHAAGETVTAGMVKTGVGTMQIKTTNGYAANGRIDVCAGTLEYNGNSIYSGAYDQWVCVNTNATLFFNGRRPFVLADGLMKTKFHIDHGTLKVADPDNVAGVYYLGDELVLDGATLDIDTVAIADTETVPGVVTFGGLLWFKGETPYDFSPKATRQANNRVSLGTDPRTEIRVDDITHDDTADVTIGYRLCDRFIEATQTTPLVHTPGGFVKTGAGRLALTKKCTFAGDMDVSNGVVSVERGDAQALNGQLSVTYLGDMTVEGRKITVAENGTLDFSNRAPFMQFDATQDDGGNRIRTETVAAGGMLKFRNVIGAVEFGPMTVAGGSVFDFTVPTSLYGPFNFRGTFRVTGDEPLAIGCPPEWADSGTGNYGRGGSLQLYPGQACVFDVGDVVTDGRIDFDLGLALTKYSDKDGVKYQDKYSYGFIKRGDGTMALSHTATQQRPRVFDGTATVEAGALLVNADYSQGGAFEVEAGAAIGGTGTISSLTLEDGAGFAGVAGQGGELVVNSDVALPETGVVKVTLPAGVDPATCGRTTLFRVAPGWNLTGTENIRNWQVFVEGREGVYFSVSVTPDGRGLRVGPQRGFFLMIR